MNQSDTKPQDARFRPNRTFICSVVYIDIVEYSKKPVNEQIAVKERFNSLLTDAIKDISINDRIILDTGDGAAISFLGDPEDALFVAMSFRDDLAERIDEIGLDLRVRIGINLGPVKLLKDINNQPNLIGDGINVAQRIMSFAEPGQLLVSRSYYEIVSCLSQEYAKLFEYQGARADKHIREHDIYSVGRSETGAQSLHGQHKLPVNMVVENLQAAPAPPHQPAQAGIESSPAAAPGPAQGPVAETGPKKKMLLAGGAIAAVVIAAAALVFIPKGNAPDRPVDGRKTAIEEKASKSEKASKRAAAETGSEAVDRAGSKTETAAEKKEVVETAAAKPAKKAEAKAEPKKESFRPASAGADGISFTLTGVKASRNQITYTVRASNKSNAAKSIALYDDAFRWPKSKVTDAGGATHEVNTVNFVKNSKTVTAQAAGREGLTLGHNESATIHLTFKNISKRVKEFKLHPFIYQGRSWKEHDLAMSR